MKISFDVKLSAKSDVILNFAGRSCNETETCIMKGRAYSSELRTITRKRKLSSPRVETVPRALNYCVNVVETEPPRFSIADEWRRSEARTKRLVRSTYSRVTRKLRCWISALRAPAIGSCRLTWLENLEDGERGPRIILEICRDISRSGGLLQIPIRQLFVPFLSPMAAIQNPLFHLILHSAA